MSGVYDVSSQPSTATASFASRGGGGGGGGGGGAAGAASGGVGEAASSYDNPLYSGGSRDAVDRYGSVDR
jgi:hypothetical protein